MKQFTDQAIESIVKRVQNIYPDFNIHSVRWLNSGQNNDAVIFNHSWLFRFPHNKVAAINLRNEVAILRILKGVLPVEIPYPQYVHLEAIDTAQSFMGYHMIDGDPLHTKWVHGIDMNDLSAIASQLNDFLQALHSISIPKEISNQISGVNTFDYWSNIYERIQRLLFPLMKTEACAKVCHHFESFLETAGEFDLALIHGDFGAGNILVDELTKRVVGVIDFGSVGISDPAVDYAAVSTIHPKMFDMIIKHYPNVVEYVPRIDFYKGTFALQEALYGAESGDDAALQSGLKQYM